MNIEKDTKKIELNIKAYLDEGLFKKGDFEYLTDFYLNTAKKTLSTADALMQLSNNAELKQKFNLLEDFETYLWIITTSYYSIFYAVNALFSKNNIKIGDRLVHKVTSDVFYYYFIQNNKVAKELFDIFEEAKESAMDITNTKYPEEAEELSKDLEFERKKRHKFQYNMTISIKKSYAQTSLKRALEFVNKIEMLIKFKDEVKK